MDYSFVQECLRRDFSLDYLAFRYLLLKYIAPSSTELSIMFGDKLGQMTRFTHPQLSSDSCPIQL
jgi:hypothetical protein